MSTVPTTTAPMSSGDAMRERFKTLTALDQAQELSELTSIHVKSVKNLSKTTKKKVRDPDAPPKEQPEGVKQWHNDIRKVQEEFGIKKDTKGDPIYKIDPKTGESKPDYVMDWSKAMKIASERRNGESSTEAPNKVKKSVKTTGPVTTEAPKTARAKAVPAAPTVNEDEEEYTVEEPMPFIFKGESLLKYANGDTWVRNPDNTRGDWKGKFIPAKKRFENTAPEDEPNY